MVGVEISNDQSDWQSIFNFLRITNAVEFKQNYYIHDMLELRGETNAQDYKFYNLEN
jgi:hypothetical protein